MDGHVSRMKRAAAIAGTGVLFGAASVLGGNGVGAVLNLGTENTVDRTTIVSGSQDGATLRLLNTGVTELARGLSAFSRGVRGTILAENTGTGPALTATVRGGVPPIAVNSSGKVANLNVDLLDGNDASAFARGTGAAIFSNRLIIHHIPEEPISGRARLLTLPYLGRITASCPDENEGKWAHIYFENTSGYDVDLWMADPSTDARNLHYEAITIRSGGQTSIAIWGGGHQIHARMHLGRGATSRFSGKTVADIASFLRRDTGKPCTVQVVATVWGIAPLDIRP
jgi:hypothetical protein